MARRAKHPTDQYAKLTYFASILILKNHSPEMSYFEAEVLENDEDPVSVYIPFFYGAVKAQEEMDSEAWKTCCKDTILPDELEQVIEPSWHLSASIRPFLRPGSTDRLHKLCVKPVFNLPGYWSIDLRICSPAKVHGERQG